MRLASSAGRALLVHDTPDGAILGLDVHEASEGRFPADVQELFAVWDDLCAWAATLDQRAQATLVELTALECPVPRPGQVFAIGLNYAEHGVESGLGCVKDGVPPTFTKFRSSLAPPFGDLALRSGTVDWEVELVVVIGRAADHVPVSEALDHVAGYAVGQDYSDRALQFVGGAPQFSLAKSFPGYGPIGPWIVTKDEVDDALDLQIACKVNGEPVQKARTSEMLWTVPELIESLSAICPLAPGDVLFTGTPAGIGATRNPPLFLRPGDVVVSSINGIGAIQQTCH
ncbi:fumarylacetoacetate hydrolase family protein [Streptomyces sp. CA-249302]|uniref:fumarylacetoacetate hydrolase family protein n=1 Tax=Streptomyces sp. CA-249302 TaxID=3240058 RepID=UPI003D8D0ED5